MLALAVGLGERPSAGAVAQAARTPSAELQVALLFRGGVVPAVIICFVCVQVCADARPRLSCAVAVQWRRWS